MEEQILYTKYALLSFSDYFKLNMQISEALGYNLTDATAIYDNVVPNLAKVNITYTDEVENYATLAVMQLTVEVQERFPELLEGLELVDTYTSADAILTVEATGLNTNQIDYTLNHIAAVSPTIELIQLESEPRSTESDKSVDILVANGITIITVI